MKRPVSLEWENDERPLRSLWDGDASLEEKIVFPKGMKWWDKVVSDWDFEAVTDAQLGHPVSLTVARMKTNNT